MTARRQLARAVIPGLVVTVLLAGCSAFSSGSSSSPTTTGGATAPASTKSSSPTKPTAQPPAPAPQVGTCRDLAYSDIAQFSDSTPTTSCKKPHTSYTFDVRTLPGAIAFPGVQIGNDAVQSAAAAKCQAAFGRFIGGDAATRALARLSVTYFVPAQPDFDKGAHWVRCDVVALQSANLLAPLPRHVRKLLDHRSAIDRFGVCAKGEPASATAQLVMCTQTHAFRAVGALRLGGTDAPYPGSTVTRTDGQQRCKDLLASLLGPGGGYTYSWTYPSPQDWRSGQRFGYCWHKTSS